MVASKVRFVPYSEHPRTVCMRVEVYGCKISKEEEDGDVVREYAAPKGQEFSPHVFLVRRS